METQCTIPPPPPLQGTAGDPGKEGDTGLRGRKGPPGLSGRAGADGFPVSYVHTSTLLYTLWNFMYIILCMLHNNISMNVVCTHVSSSLSMYLHTVRTYVRMCVCTYIHVPACCFLRTCAG